MESVLQFAFLGAGDSIGGDFEVIHKDGGLANFKDDLRWLIAEVLLRGLRPLLKSNMPENTLKNSICGIIKSVKLSFEKKKD